VIGRSYSEMTRRAQVAVDTMRAGGNPAGHPALVESRPVGEQHLYAQVAPLGPPEPPRLGQPHVGKRKPLLDETKGVRDFRNARVGVGTNGFGSMRAVPTASLAPTPFGNKIPFTGREKGEKTLPSDYPPPVGHMPGYTGHLHASKHIYGKSYGHTSRQLVVEADAAGSDEPTTPPSREFETRRAQSAHLHVSGRLSGYAEHNPQGTRGFDDANRRAHIPGYTGHVPVKNVEMYGVSYGRATGLAPSAERAIKAGAVGAAMPSLSESRPAGEPERYAQALLPTVPGKPVPYVAQPLAYRLSKGAVDVSAFKERGEDNKWRAARGEDVAEVIRGEHRVPGCTLYTHGRNHVFGESSAKMTRRLRGGHMTNPTTSVELLHFRDARPQAGNSNAPEVLI
jgi:hypothetical protein